MVLINLCALKCFVWIWRLWMMWTDCKQTLEKCLLSLLVCVWLFVWQHISSCLVGSTRIEGIGNNVSTCRHMLRMDWILSWPVDPKLSAYQQTDETTVRLRLLTWVLGKVTAWLRKLPRSLVASLKGAGFRRAGWHHYTCICGIYIYTYI